MLYKFEEALELSSTSPKLSPPLRYARMNLNWIYSSVLFSVLFTSVLGLGTSCSAPLGAGTAAASDPFWMQNIKHQGLSAFNANPSSYQVFRNVKVRMCAAFVSYLNQCFLHRILERRATESPMTPQLSSRQL